MGLRASGLPRRSLTRSCWANVLSEAIHLQESLLYDAEGNERGGYVTDEDRNVALTLDEINRAAVHLGVNDRGEMHLALSNGRGGYAAMGVLPSGAWLRLDKPGQPPTLLPMTTEEKPK